MQETWPTDIARQVARILGSEPQVSAPGVLSGSTVQRLTGNGASLILKQSDNSREWHVYTRLADLFSRNGINIPRLFAEAVSDNVWWLLLEDIKLELPAQRRLADVAVIQVLRNLHSLPVSGIDLPPNPYRPEWPEAMSRNALTLFEAPVAASLHEPLERIRRACAPLFEPHYPVSTDPNPANWGVRSDGTPVLFDWERFTLGTPPLDLAISVPGLGTCEDYRLVSRAYAGDDRLAAAIAHAKTWSVIEFLCGCASGEIEPAFDINALVHRVPEWIGTEIMPMLDDMG